MTFTFAIAATAGADPARGGPSAWAVFDQERLAAEGSVAVDMERCAEIAAGFKAAMAATPPPPCPAERARTGTDGEFYS